MLTIIINSFSYKRGMPYDNSGNGGGYVFDCRGLPNPGRLEAFKTKTGNDKEVIDYLDIENSTPIFLEAIQKLISLTIDNYIERGFSNLSINFGCTGGQHRSVYCANAIGVYVKLKYPQTQLELTHLELNKIKI